MLIEGFDKEVIFGSVEDFYYLARTCLVKDEKYFDRFDIEFSAYFKGIINVDAVEARIPEEWLRRLAEIAGLPGGLREAGVPEEAISRLAEDAGKQWTGKFNPRPFDTAAAVEIYHRAL